MGTKYTATAVSGYNSAPPADDASQTAANQVFWSTIKTKLGDPLNTFAASVDAKIATALDTSCRKITASDSSIAGDNLRTIEIGSTVSTGITVSLGDAATMAAGYMVTVSNQCAISQTIGRVTSANTLNGTAANITLPALCSATLVVNQAATGYNLVGQGNNASFGTTAATQTQMEAATDNTVSVTPLAANWHPGMCKVWCKAGITGNNLASWNMTSVTDAGVGLVTFVIATDFSSANYVGLLAVLTDGIRTQVLQTIAQAAGSFQAQLGRTAVDEADPINWFFSAFGDQ